MTRYVVTEFRSDEDAEEYIRQTNEATKSGKRYRVVGLFAPPRLFACQCSRIEAGYKKPKSERGSKFGWWLCGLCGKPEAAGHQLSNLIPLREIFGRGPQKMVPRSTDGNDYEWKIESLSIYSVPLDNIDRKKKRRVWK